MSRPGMRLEHRTYRKTQSENEKVAAWIREDDRSWKEGRIKESLVEVDVDEVLNVPIPLHPRSDSLRWPYTIDGSVSVRSAYHQIRGREQLESNQDQRMWASIWKSKV